jgi:uncharacterized membrane protein
MYIAGILWFAVGPALANGRWQTALFNGAILGCLCYATYDLTNLATLKDWPVMVTVIDLIWGSVLAASVSVLTYLISVRI